MIWIKISSGYSSFEPEVDIHGCLSEEELWTVRNRLDEAMDIVSRLLESIKEEKECR